jgi:hypothetical protein
MFVIDLILNLIYFFVVGWIALWVLSYVVVMVATGIQKLRQH